MGGTPQKIARSYIDLAELDQIDLVGGVIVESGTTEKIGRTGRFAP
jgi:hypothetical protein